MTNVLDEQSEEDKHLAAKSKHENLMWLLLIGGVLLVCFAMPLGQVLVPKTQYASGSFSWSPDNVREIALVLRILGVMAFAAGLVERLILNIRDNRKF